MILVLAISVLFASCTSSDYVHVIPKKCTALVSIDATAMGSQAKLGKNAGPLLSLLHVTDPADCGIDFGSKVYLFETQDGTFGMTAKVSSSSKLGVCLEKLSQKGVGLPLLDKRGFKFTVINGKWVVGFSNQAILAMGPALSNEQPSLILKMSRYLSQDEKQSIVGTPMFDKVDSIQSGVAMVVQAQALPEKLVSLFTLGTPKNANPSQIAIAARISVEDNILKIIGETFSFNERINESLRKSSVVFRPIQGNYNRFAKSCSLFSLFMNVDGKQFLPLLRQDKSLQSLLMGMNTAIDMDNIIKSIDGDVAFATDNMDVEHLSLSMGAHMSSLSFVNDIGYWKQSCPKGSSIVDWQKDSWLFTNGKQNFYFGVKAGSPSVFYSGTDPQSAMRMCIPPSEGSKESLQYQGEKMVAVINIEKIDNEVVKTLVSLLEPVFGKLSSIVYYRK